jgi:hypothetical protein
MLNLLRRCLVLPTCLRIADVAMPVTPTGPHQASGEEQKCPWRCRVGVRQRHGLNGYFSRSLGGVTPRHVRAIDTLPTARTATERLAAPVRSLFRRG